MSEVHYHDDNGNGLGALLIFLAVLLIILLAIVSQLFIIGGVVVIIFGVIVLVYGINNEEEITIIYGIIYIVVGIAAILLGNWIYGFLVSSGALDFIKNIFALFKN
ncbi:MAG: hypothetical protein WC511_03990 [Candidatus Pacearchaeota archaeon]